MKETFLLLPAGLVVSLECCGLTGFFSEVDYTIEAEKEKVMTRLVLSLFVVAAVMLAGTSVLTAADDAVTHEGSIVKVDKDQMTIKGEEAQTVVGLSPTTKITLDGKAAKLEDLKPGFKVKTTCKKEGTKFIATLVDAKSA